jgi:hypothetical protein
MKNILALLFLFVSSVVYSQTFKITEADLTRVYNTQVGKTLFNSTVFTVGDTITRKSGTAVYSRLSRFGRAVLYLNKINGKYVGRIFKNNEVRYDLEKQDTTYAFVVKEAKDFISEAKTQTPEEFLKYNKQIKIEKELPISNGTSFSDSLLVKNGWGCILLDFNGHTVENTGWNYAGPIVCAPVTYANSPDTITYVMNRVKEFLYPFKVVATTDTAIYFLANPNRRIRTIVTSSYEWYGNSAGVSFIGSFTWGDDTPNFAFYKPGSINVPFWYNVDCIKHEIGHPFGLYHQARYNTSCVKTDDYNRGYGTGETSFAPVMGLNSSNRNMVIWWNGPNPYGCTSFQNDMDIILAYNGFGIRAPEDGINFKSARTLTAGGSIYQSLIPYASDSDYVRVMVTTTGTTTFTASPWNDGANNAHAICKMKIRLYTLEGAFIAESNNPTTLSATISQSLNPGFYYIVVYKEGVTDNTTGYGMYGHYRLTQN